MDMLFRDVRYAARGLRRAPGFTLVAVLSLALGIGANTAIFSVLDALMWHGLPVADRSRLALANPSGPFPLTYAQFERLRDASSGADLSAIVRTDRYNVQLSAGSGGQAASIDEGPVRVGLVSGNYFATMNVAAAVGRALTDGDDREGAPPVAVISHAYWRRRFGGAPDVLGRQLTASDVVFDIAGVAPMGFAGEWVGRPVDVWMPLVAQPRIMTEIPVGLPNTGVTAIGRRRPGVSIESMRAELQLAFARDLRERAGPHPDARQLRDIASSRLQVEPGARGYSPQRASFGQSLTILMLAVGLLLLTACANIANLMLSRADARCRELSVRVALGASRGQLLRHMLVESLLVSAAAGVLGLAVARVAAAALGEFLRTTSAGRGLVLSLDLDLSTDLRWLMFTAALSIVSAVSFGLLPALHASRPSPSAFLSGRGADAATASGAFRPGHVLVVAQVACSLVLLVGAGLFARTLRNLSMQDVGFARDRLLLVWTLPGQTAGRGVAAAGFWQRVTERLAALPGVESVGASNQGVLNGAESDVNGPGLRVEGEPPAATGIPGWRSFVTPDFFRTIGVPLIAGREFTERDTAAASRVVIVNKTFAFYYFGDKNPVGRHVWFPEDAGAPTEIIGVAADSTGGTPRESLRPPGLTYFSYRDKEAARRLRTMTVGVRTRGNAIVLAPRIRQALREVDPNLPVVKIDTVDEQLADVLIQERVIATLSAFFGAMALLLACLGLYGVVSYSVGRRTSEIGIRIALGATRPKVLGLVVGESLWMVGAGLAIGILVTIAAARLISARLFGVSATDPLTIGSATLLLMLVAIAAAVVPARRASRVDPMVTLRSE
jgi:predicted permease